MSAPEPLWTRAEVLAATGGAPHGPDFVASGVSIDSRTLVPGDLFVALAGERDGHAFAQAALAAGAAGVLADRPLDGPAVVVGDTLGALRGLAACARRRAASVRLGAVTGSVGKTGVTQAVLAGLAAAGSAHGSVQSYNNHIGVPLTLARMPPATARAILEIGMNHAGEISPLSVLAAPEAVAITTVGAVHTENFADGEAGVARAKAEIFAGLAPGGVAVLDADSPWFDFLAGEAARAGARLRTFGRSVGADARLLTVAPERGGIAVEAAIDGARLSWRLRHAGTHWGLMSLCALLLMTALGVERQAGLAALSTFAPLPGRGAVRSIAVPGGCALLIDDSYNANPLSMVAALASLALRADASRRIAVLTDMLELGEGAGAAHAALAEAIEGAKVDLVFCAGPFMAALFEALPQSRRGAWASDAETLLASVGPVLAPGDAVLVKGSKGSRAHLIAAALTKGAA